MNADEILARVDELRVWQQHDERAPHKPLLLLLALGRLENDEASLPFETCERKLGELLREFGPPRHRQQPELPFWHLRNDGLWEVVADAEIPLGRNGRRPRKGDLRRLHAEGRFPESVRRLLRDDPRLVSEIGRRILDAHFPETVHSDILDAVALSLDLETTTRRRRDPAFRHRVLQAYGYRCAVCALSLRLADVTIALEAAHIRWHQAGGPDEESNGFALCSLHHKVFDLGAFTVEDGRVLVSELVHDDDRCEHALLRHHGRPVNDPVRPEQRPRPEHLGWHRREVFREWARP